MDAFEHIVAAILDREGYWTRKEVKVEITKDEKKQIGRPSSPRWEIDVVGYKAAMNEIWVVECKSYLDSKGVSADAFTGNAGSNDRFKLFNKVGEAIRATRALSGEAKGSSLSCRRHGSD